VCTLLMLHEGIVPLAEWGLRAIRNLAMNNNAEALMVSSIVFQCFYVYVRTLSVCVCSCSAYLFVYQCRYPVLWCMVHILLVAAAVSSRSLTFMLCVHSYVRASSESEQSTQ
jgi:hypothetical protein